MNTVYGRGNVDQQQVAEVLDAYYAAQAQGETGRACGYLTGARREELVRVVNSVPSNERLASCADALGFILDAPGGHALVKDVRIGEVKVTGDRAEAKAVVASSDATSVSTTDYVLIKTEEGWRIAAGSGSTTISPTSAVEP